MVIYQCGDWGCKHNHYNTDVKPSQPGQNVGRTRHQGLSRQHSTSNLGDSNSFIFSWNIVGWKSIIYVLVKLPPFPTQLVLYSLESWCKRIDCICLSGANVWQWIQNGKFNLKVLIEFVKERVFSFWCLGFIDFCCFCTLQQTQKGGMQTVLSGYDRLVTDSKVRRLLTNVTYDIFYS